MLTVAGMSLWNLPRLLARLNLPVIIVFIASQLAGGPELSCGFSHCQLGHGEIMELIAHCSLSRGKKIPEDRSESHCSLPRGKKIIPEDRSESHFSLNRGHVNQRIGSESHCSLENCFHSFQNVPQQSHCQASILNSQVGSTVKSWWQSRPMAQLVKKDAQITKVCCPTECLTRKLVSDDLGRGFFSISCKPL
jgi:hypothetical protein